MKAHKIISHNNFKRRKTKDDDYQRNMHVIFSEWKWQKINNNKIIEDNEQLYEETLEDFATPTN